MIGYAVKKVISVSKKNLENVNTDMENGQEKCMEESLEQIEKALLKSYKSGKIYDCSGECEGFSQYPQVYGAYPWSLGPGARFFIS